MRPRTRGASRFGAFGGAILAAIVLSAPVSASTAEPVEIDLHVVFGGPETFNAAGFCPSGTAQSFGFHQAGQGRATTFHLYKTLTCGDGSGTLTIRVEAGLVFGSPGTVGGWSVVNGTGDYADARGGGMIVGTSFDGGIDDAYTGRLSR
jgi:hypothetical protein